MDPMQRLWISLPADNDSTFHVSSLLSHLNDRKRDCIVLGEQQRSLSKHTQRHSLDYWLRTAIARNADAAQATQTVLKQLCDTGLFQIDHHVPCPDTGTPCTGLRLIEFG
jgi:hypothetical protein